MLTPVTVGRVKDIGSRNHRCGKKLAVGLVEIIHNKLTETTASIAARRDRNSENTDPSVHVVEHMLDELVPNSGNSC